MPTGNPAHLLKLADREFRQLSEERPAASPPSRKFRPMKLNVNKLDGSWDRKRGAAVRLTAVLLREDDAALQRRVRENDKTVKTYTTAADWLARESAYLRKVARLLDTAGGRLSTVLGRCQSGQSIAP
jgi:division protein CdvB (Snf7/Vps24/ESCRT-III family)